MKTLPEKQCKAQHTTPRSPDGVSSPDLRIFLASDLTFGPISRKK